MSYTSIRQDVISRKTELLFLITSFVFFITDFFTDFALAVKYHRQGDSLWFFLTVTFMVAPYLVGFIMVAVNTKECTKRTLSFFLRLPISLFLRYKEEFKLWKRRYWDNSPCEGGEENCDCDECRRYRQAIQEPNDSAYELAWLHYVEAITESTPQWCLQVYIMLYNWDFPRLTVISTFFSFFSLPLSITTLERARVTKNRNDFKFCPHTVLFFSCQTFTLLSRLCTIVTLAYTWHFWFFLLLFLHWCSLNYICLRGLNEMWPWWCFILFSIITPLYPLTLPFLFHPTEAYHYWLSKEPKILLRDETKSCFSFGYCTLFAMISVENIVLTPLAVRFPRSDAAHMDVILPIALTFVAFGSFLSAILSKLYYGKYYKEPVDQYENLDSIMTQ